MTRAMNVLRLALVSLATVLSLAIVSAAQAKTSGTKFPYVFSNSDGSKTIIRSEPKRVVALDNFDALSGLGAHVVGASISLAPHQSGGDAQGEPNWLNGGELSGVTPIDGFGGPDDYEAIAALHPDLIIGGGSPTVVAQLSQIAPTIQPGRLSSLPPGPLLPDAFGWEELVKQVAPIFNATAHVNAMIARMHQRTAAAAPFIRGSSVAIVIPDGTQDFLINYYSGNTGDFFHLTGAKIQSSIHGASSLGGGLSDVSTEDLADLTAQKVLFLSDFNTFSEAGVKALPLYPKIPAFKTHQIYFTQWDFTGAVGTADYSAQFQKQLYGVTGLEATLAGTGKQSSNRSGVADVDVGPTEKRVCWDLSTTGNVGHPSAAVIENTKGVELFTLGKSYHTSGCANVTRSAAKKLLSSPNYDVAVEKGSTVLLQGAVGKQSPAFFGTGKDKPFTQ
jgi:iron complex transport system substrate-binding protein